MSNHIYKNLQNTTLRYAVYVCVVWTMVNGFSVMWNVKEEQQKTVEIARQVAGSSYDKQQAIRLWATSHGGVYVEPSEQTPPNPWLSHIPDRDIVTKEGKKLTLMNSSYMLREMMENFSDLYGIKGRIVSIEYLNPKNKADAWEERAIRSFEKGAKEKMELFEEEGSEYLRLMRPLEVEEGCLKCHTPSTTQKGSILGGMGVYVPMSPYRAIEQISVKSIYTTYFMIWAVGILAILFVTYRMRLQLVEREKDLEELTLSSHVFENMLDAIVITDKNATILRANPAFLKLTGYSLDELLGQNPRILKSEYHSKLYYEKMWESILAYGSWQGEIKNRTKSGELIVARQSISPVKDDKGEIKYLIGTLHDITDKKISEERIFRLAHYDILTDLPNRILFQDRFEHAIEQAERMHKRLALFFIDLDTFKKINDTKGHPVGDKLLVEVSKRIRACVRRSDTVARLGGDEFTILVENFTSIDDLVAMSMTVLEALSGQITVGGHTLFVTGSIGISVYPDDGEDVHTLIQHADTAMYRAKENGKNRFSFYEKTMTEQAEEHLFLETALRKAIKEREFVVYYQPKVSLKENRVIGMEALVRWFHPDQGLIMPDKFIPLAEELHIIDQIDAYVLEQACNDTKIWRDKGYDIHVAVNLSGYDISNIALVENVKEICERASFDPAHLELEITESYFINFEPVHMEVLSQLKELGVKLSIDDFGTGYSSLSNLNKLPVETLKIDMSFIQSMQPDTPDEKMVSMIIMMAHNMGLNVVAEGVETEYQRDYLKANDCDHIQGYFIGKPLDSGAFEHFLEQW